MLPVNDMMLFVDVVKHKSFTTAAEKNNKTAAAVSKRIASLEKTLGTELLKRTTRNLALTDAGQVLFNHFENMHLGIQNVLEEVINVQKKPKGKIRISALTNFCNLILAPLIGKFLEDYPDIEVDLNLEKALGALPSLDEYDLAFRSGKLIDSTAVSRHLFTHTYIVCASPIYLAKYGLPKSLIDLSKHNCVDCRHGCKNSDNIWTFFDGKKSYHIPVKGKIFTDNALLVKYLALSHIALIYSPSFIVADDINNGRLVPVLQQYRTIDNPIYMIHPYSNRNVPKRIRLFMDFIIENINIPTLKTA